MTNTASTYFDASPKRRISLGWIPLFVVFSLGLLSSLSFILLLQIFILGIIAGLIIGLILR